MTQLERVKKWREFTALCARKRELESLSLMIDAARRDLDLPGCDHTDETGASVIVDHPWIVSGGWTWCPICGATWEKGKRL